MPLTLNQFIVLVLAVASAVAVTFITILIVQLRRTAKEAEKTLVEIRTLAQNLQTASERVRHKIDDMDDVLQATKKTAVSLSEIAWFAAAKVVRPSARYWPFLFPLLRFGWRQMKKRKEKKNGK